jgi:hypothetical protein
VAMPEKENPKLFHAYLKGERSNRGNVGAPKNGCRSKRSSFLSENLDFTNNTRVK